MSQQQPQQYGAGVEGQQFQGGQQYGQGAQQAQFQGTQPQFQQGGYGTTAGGAQAQPSMDIKLEEGLTDEMRVALHDFIQSATACEWCAERCIDHGPEMAECLRLCRDVADLATLNAQLIARDSVFGPEAAQVFANAAEACAQECSRHSHRHCQECAEVLSRAVRSTRKMLNSFGQQGGMAVQGQQPGGGGLQSQPQPQQSQPGQGF